MDFDWNNIVSQKDKIVDIIQNDLDGTTVALAVGGVLATFFLASTIFGSKTSKSDRPKPVKVKQEKTTTVDPVKEGNRIIKEVINELKEVIIPEIERLEADIKIEQEGGQLEDNSYKNKTKYRYLYLNEIFLKMLVRLDSIDPHTFGDNVSDEVKSKIREKRKTAVKAVSIQDKRLQKLRDLVI
ncbi:hypothetical protein DAPK24_036170 [Pichia kluyveri]|uniref:BAG domain-containing protein n=1 Tax=Pichia kluyveri TaxID=36015 RepID=A0AAV5R6W1_PICKL|nr:hypothetical protein DAPK24_036170 [Pichia kluyveri]